MSTDADIARRRKAVSGTRAAALSSLALVLSACANSPHGRLIDLTLKPDSPTWPAPPETARYALVGELTGAADFAAARGKLRSGAGRILRAIAGLAVGKRRYQELRRPVAGFTDADGSIFVADMSLQGIAKFDMAQSKFSIWRNAARREAFVAPSAVISDGAGGVYVSDAEKGEVFRLNAEGDPVGRFGAGILKRPLGLARDPTDGAVFVADSEDYKIKKFSADGDFLSAIGGAGQTAGALNTPTYLAFSNGVLYVSDTFNFRVQEFDRDGRLLMQFGKNGDFVGAMARPKGVAVGGGGRIYVVESLFDRLLIFDDQGRLLMTLAGEGAKARSFYLPSGVWTDETGRVYVADMFNGRIVIYDELTPLAAEASNANAQ
ncbi:MAG TPA: hypothetical protein VNH64_12210 [Parvularculaceae bacterium]|nr:hypothetical protein [Parvularculaceae bacterium]